MLSLQRAATSGGDHDSDHDDHEHIRDIHALSPPRPPLIASHRHSSSPSMASEGASSENFTSISREFNALVLAGSTMTNNTTNDQLGNTNLVRIGEEADVPEETNPLAIVPDSNPLHHVTSPTRHANNDASGRSIVASSGNNHGELSVQRVKSEEVEAKITAWQNAKIAKINNRFKREDAVSNGWESEQVEKASSWMKKVERKLEEKRAKALEKMQNDVAKAHRKAEERRASAEAKRGTKVARILEIANLMRAVGRAPTKRSFF